MDRERQLSEEQVELRLPFQLMPPPQEATLRRIAVACVVEHPPQPEATDQCDREQSLQQAVEVDHGSVNVWFVEVLCWLHQGMYLASSPSCFNRCCQGSGATFNSSGIFAAAMLDTKPCPECRSTITYPTGSSWMCDECGHEWNPDEVAAANAWPVIKDANGNVLQDGDDVVVIKDLPVKGMPKPVKAGTKVKNIRLVEGDHDIDCRIEGFGAMGLKSMYVKKA